MAPIPRESARSHLFRDQSPAFADRIPSIGTVVPERERKVADRPGIAEAVRRRRRQLSLTQQDAADLAGVSVRFLRALEQGKPSVQLDRVIAVLDALGLELTVTLREVTHAR